nr:hypothetical protein [Actinomycetota bacterium]
MSTTVLILAGLVAFVVAALAGWLFLRADRLSEEGRTRRRWRGPPTGTVLAVATMAGALGIGAAWLDGRSLVLLALAVVLGAFGLAVERRRLRPSLRVAAEVAAGGVAVVLGLRSGLTGTTLTSAVVVVGFVVIMVESLRLLDAAPRAAPSVAVPSVAALAVVAAGAGQDGLATLALALAGALVGLLAAGTRRAFWLGESGCLFCGFLLATLVVAVNPSTPAPLSIAVLLPVVAVPLVNSVVVTGDRLRRRRALTDRRPDGLPHRLRAAPLPWLWMVLALGGVQALLSVVVVLADRGAVPVAAPLLVGAATMALLALLARPGTAKIHRHPAPGLSLTT